MVSNTGERLRQTIAVLTKIRDDLGIPYESPEVQTLKGHLDTFVRTGEPWEGTVGFEAWDRVAHVALAKSGRVEVTLKCVRKRKQRQ